MNNNTRRFLQSYFRSVSAQFRSRHNSRAIRPQSHPRSFLPEQYEERVMLAGASIGTMAPSGITTAPVSSVDVTFDQVVQHATFTQDDIAIQAPDGQVINLSADPVDSGDQQTFTLNADFRRWELDDIGGCGTWDLLRDSRFFACEVSSFFWGRAGFRWGLVGGGAGRSVGGFQDFRRISSSWG